MPHNHEAKATVIGLPKRVTNRQIRLTVAVETGMGGTPAIRAINEGKLLKSRQPLPCAFVAQLAVGGVLAQAVLQRLHTVVIETVVIETVVIETVVFEGVYEILLMIPAQPRCTTHLDQIPDQIHRCGNGFTTVDHISAEHQMVIRRKDCEEIDQRLMAAMHISNDPMSVAAQVQGTTWR